VAAVDRVSDLVRRLPGKVLTLCWADVNTQCNGINIRDKVKDTPEITANPYMLHLLTVA
jgi:hypothetical protein